jgi:protein glucosyltransferase
LTFSVTFSQIELDLAPWAESGVTASMLKEAGQVPRNSLYQIIVGKLYRSGDPMFPARSSGVEHFLLKVAKDLPDTEFVLNTKDWPQRQSHRPLPIFSFSKVVSRLAG